MNANERDGRKLHQLAEKAFSMNALHGVIEFPSNRPFDHIFFAVSIVTDTFGARRDEFMGLSKFYALGKNC